MTNEQLKSILLNSKWEVTPEQSAYLQQRAFEIGYDWKGGDKSIMYEYAKYLYFYDNYIIYHGGTNEMYKYNQNTLRIFSDIFPEFGKEISEGKDVVIETLISGQKEQSARFEELKKENFQLKEFLKEIKEYFSDGTETDLEIIIDKIEKLIKL